MKKENRKAAQEQRAAQRKKQAQEDSIKKICMFGLPALALIVLIVLIVTNPFSCNSAVSDANDSVSLDSSYTDNTTEIAPPVLQTDSSLTIEDGDLVNIDYVGSIDGVEFAGGNTQGMGADLAIGSGQYIDTFEEQLIGAHPGDTVNVVVTFPENYGNEELNGKEALFVTVVNGIYE